MAGAFKPEREIIIVEILDEIRDWNSSYSEVLSVMVEKWHIASRTFDRYWKIASERHKLALESEQKVKEEIRLEAVRNRALNAIASKEERMQTLTKILRGEIPLKKYIVCDGVIQEREVVPNYNDRKAAIAELNKMDGSYADDPETHNDITEIKIKRIGT